VSIEDPGGTTRFSYDARGRIIRKRWQAAAGGTDLALDFTYRADDQVSRIDYPSAGGARLSATHQYNARGQLDAIPTIIEKMNYDLAGRRVGASFANGTKEVGEYDLRGRLKTTSVSGPDGVLRHVAYTLDFAGNLTAIASPDPKLASTFVYDDLYRLVSATLGGGERFDYAYDDAGRLTHKSDVGDYRYGEGGAAQTCLTSAGTASFTYTSRGEIESARWGTQKFDVFGRLASVAAEDGLGSVEFTYDHAGKRVVARTTGDANPAVEGGPNDPRSPPPPWQENHQGPDWQDQQIAGSEKQVHISPSRTFEAQWRASRSVLCDVAHGHIV
jgi:YD repeat-containing protein